MLERRSCLAKAALILIVWCILYLPHLRSVPAWYGDETMTFSVSRELFNGNSVNFAVWNTFWGPFYPYQPIYSWICGFFGFLFEDDIVGGRFFNVLLALVAAFSIYLLGSKALGSNAAFFSALIFLTYFQILIHFRMCYAHNAAGLGVLLCSIGLLGEPSKKNLFLIGIGLAIASAAHPLFIYPALAVFICKIKNPSEWIPAFFPCIAIIVSSLIFSYSQFGVWLMEDLKDLFLAYETTAKNIPSTFAQLQNISNFIRIDFFHFASVGSCLIFLLKKRWRVVFIFFVCLFFLTKNRANLPIFYYQAILITPTMCLMLSGFVEVCEQIKNSYVRFCSLLLVWAVPTFSGLSNLLKVLDEKLYPLNNYWVTQSCEEVEQAALWLNQRTTSEETVAANENIGWLLKAKAIPYIQMITWYGFPTQGLSRKKERFRFNASLENVSYAVIGDIDVRWAFGNENVSKIPMIMESERWPIVWRGNYYSIFANPRKIR